METISIDSVSLDNYFESRMKQFMMEMNFHLGIDFDSFEQIHDDAEEAALWYDSFRKKGMGVTESLESASGVLYEKFGFSCFDAITLLWKGLMDMPENSDLTELQTDEMLLLLLAANRIFDGVERMPYGISLNAMMEFGMNKLAARVWDEYLALISVDTEGFI